MFNFKIIPIFFFAISGLAHAQTQSTLEFPDGPTAAHLSLEFTGGPTAKIDLGELKEIKEYAFDANTSIIRILAGISRVDENESGANTIVSKKIQLMKDVQTLIADSKDKRSILLLTHSLQAGMTLVKLIDQQTIAAGPERTPPGTIAQQIHILKQSLIFARDYYQSDFIFINNVLTTQEFKANPEFVEFGVKLTQFVFQMSNGIVSAPSFYGMARWTLGVLANYIKWDKNTGLAYSAIRYNLVTNLLEKNPDNTPKYPDLVNGEASPSDIQCIMKTRDMKRLAQDSFDSMKSEKTNLIQQ